MSSRHTKGGLGCDKLVEALLSASTRAADHLAASLSSGLLRGVRIALVTNAVVSLEFLQWLDLRDPRPLLAAWWRPQPLTSPARSDRRGNYARSPAGEGSVRASRRGRGSGGAAGGVTGIEADLHEQAELVGHTPVLDHHVVVEAPHVEHGDLDGLVGGRHPHHRTRVHAARPVPRPHGVAGHDQILDGQREVAHPPVQHPGDTLRPIETRVVTPLMLNEARGHERVQHRLVPGTDTLLDDPAEPVGDVYSVHASHPLSVESPSIQIECYSIEMVVKPSRDPQRRPTLREEQATVTRTRIRDAARRLFFRDGYAATTLKAIAAEAGVAVQTVYAVFGSKPAILTELRWMVVDLPEADAARLEAMHAPTAEDRLSRFAHSIRRRWELAGDIVQVNQDAARTDPSIRSQIQPAEDRRQAGIAAFVGALAADLDLRFDVARAAATVDALTMYQLYAQLVGIHAWNPDDYEAWLRAQLIATVR